MMTDAFVIGVGATIVMDLWAMLLRRAFGVRPLDLALLGRWIGHFPRGHFAHASIASAEPIPYERAMGWSTHYLIGVSWAVVLLVIAGSGWAGRPTLGPPLFVSTITLAAPFFVMQPAMGAGIAASRTPHPSAARLRSVATHTVYGLGLYASAQVWALRAG